MTSNVFIIPANISRNNIHTIMFYTISFYDDKPRAFLFHRFIFRFLVISDSGITWTPTSLKLAWHLKAVQADVLDINALFTRHLAQHH